MCGLRHEGLLTLKRAQKARTIICPAVSARSGSKKGQGDAMRNLTNTDLGMWMYMTDRRHNALRLTGPETSMICYVQNCECGNVKEKEETIH